MALIGIEGFDHWKSGDPSPFDNGGSFSQNSNTRFGYGFSAIDMSDLDWNVNNRATVIQGAAFYASPGDTTVYRSFSLLDGGSWQITLHIDYLNRRVKAMRNDTVLLGASANNSIPPAGTHLYLEWKVTINSTTGTVEVRMDGGTVLLNLTGQNTQNTANARVQVARIGGRVIDDYYLFDDQGTVNNDFAGNVRVFTEYPTSNDAVQFTPSTGSNYQNVDDPGDIDADSTYNSSATVGHKDTFGVTGDVVGTVKAVELRTTMRKTDAATCTGRGIIKSGGTQANGTTRTLGTSYEQFRDYWDVDPTDSAAWTAAKANALKIGYERVS